MDLTKQYIVQCITSAANNLRLSSEKIEAVAMLREKLNSSTDLLEELKNFKKITELSKLGIRLGEIQNYIDSGKLDFLKLSDKFKEHSHNLVRELNYVLDVLTPQMLRNIFHKYDNEAIKVDLTKRDTKADEISFNHQLEIDLPKRSKADELKEAIIFEELNKENEFNFEDFQEKILRPIKDLDQFLNRVLKFNYTENEINSCIRVMNENANLAQRAGFEVLSNMHRIFVQGLDVINQKKIAPSPNVIESLRSSLIVIVAVVRGKEVDITNYLNRAENFGRSLSSIKKDR